MIKNVKLCHHAFQYSRNSEVRISSKVFDYFSLSMSGNCPRDPISISDKTFIWKSREVSKPRDLYLELSYHYEITGTSAASLRMWLSNFKAMRIFNLPISRLRDFTRSDGNTFHRILKRSPGRLHCGQPHLHEDIKTWKRFPRYCPFVEESTDRPSQRAINMGL